MFFSAVSADLGALHGDAFLKYYDPNLGAPTSVVSGSPSLRELGFGLAAEIMPEIKLMVTKTSSLTTQSAARLVWALGSVIAADCHSLPLSTTDCHGDVQMGAFPTVGALP